MESKKSRNTLLERAKFETAKKRFTQMKRDLIKDLKYQVEKANKPLGKIEEGVDNTGALETNLQEMKNIFEKIEDKKDHLEILEDDLEMLESRAAKSLDKVASMLEKNSFSHLALQIDRIADKLDKEASLKDLIKGIKKKIKGLILPESAKEAVKIIQESLHSGTLKNIQSLLQNEFIHRESVFQLNGKTLALLGAIVFLAGSGLLGNKFIDSVLDGNEMQMKRTLTQIEQSIGK